MFVEGEQLRVHPEAGASRTETLIQTVNGQNMDALGTFTQSVPFTFGVPFFLEMELRVFGFSHAIGIAEASGLGDALNSFDWRGISGVRFGDQLVDFALTSTSGTDWTRAFPVSEPSTHALLLLGLVLVALNWKRYGLVGWSSPTVLAGSRRYGPSRSLAWNDPVLFGFVWYRG